MKPKISAVLQSTPKSMALHTVRPMRAAPGYEPVTDCVEKRDPRRAVNKSMPQTWELDITARLEKRNFASIET